MTTPKPVPVPKMSENQPNWHTHAQYNEELTAPLNFDRDGETGGRMSHKANQKVGIKGAGKKLLSAWGSILKRDANTAMTYVAEIAGFMSGLVKNPAMAACFQFCSSGLSDVIKKHNDAKDSKKSQPASLTANIIADAVIGRQASQGVMF